jgi:protein O-GlcNAc transferase
MSGGLTTARGHMDAGRMPAAEAALRRVLAGEPGNAEAHNLLGAVLIATGRTEQAVFCFERAVRLRGDHAGALVNLGSALFLLGRAGEARGPLERAVELNPHESAGWLGLASVLNQLGEPFEAADAAERALELAPDDASCVVNRAASLVATGRADEALGVLSSAMAGGGAGGVSGAGVHPRLISNYLSTLHYATRPGAVLIAREHARLGPRIAAASGPKWAAPKGERDAERKLRVGYLSSDLRGHSVAMFVRALFPHHDRERFTVVAVHTGVIDATSERIRAMVDEWIDARGMTDAALLERLRRAGIDVLVELNGHTQGHRLGVVAARAAPVQLTYLGYPDVTGVPGVDGRIVDRWTDPAGVEGEGIAGLERLERLERCFVAIEPPVGAPEPAARVGEDVVFGSFNALSKLNEPLLRMWAGVLRAVPGARLVLKNRGLDHARARAWIGSVMDREGIDPARVELIGWLASAESHWAAYGRIDVALDTYPYHGTTTTAEALWMGVPVVSRVGETHASRVGLSLLTAAGLGDLAVEGEQAFVDAARRLAADRARRAELRAGLRGRLRGSALMDGAGLARGLEGVYRARWRAWCDQG